MPQGKPQGREVSQVSRPPRPDARPRAPGVPGPRARPGRDLPTPYPAHPARNDAIAGSPVKPPSLRPLQAAPRRAGRRRGPSRFAGLGLGPVRCLLARSPAQAGVWRQRRRRSARLLAGSLSSLAGLPAFAIRAPPVVLTFGARPAPGPAGLGSGGAQSPANGRASGQRPGSARHRGASLAGRTWGGPRVRGGVGRGHVAAWRRGGAEAPQTKNAALCACPRRPGRGEEAGRVPPRRDGGTGACGELRAGAAWELPGVRDADQRGRRVACPRSGPEAWDPWGLGSDPNSTAQAQGPCCIMGTCRG